MTAFLTDLFKRFELERLEAECNPVIADVRYAFHHDDLHLAEHHIFRGREPYWTLDGAMPGEASLLIEWLEPCGLTFYVWHHREDRQGLNLGLPPYDHPASYQVRAYLASGWPLPPVSYGATWRGPGVMINRATFSQDLLGRGRRFLETDCPLFHLAGWMNECELAGTYMG
jgi:hypothetical protein